MAMEITVSQARANLSKLCERVARHNETIIIRRRGTKNVALVSADELSSLLETVHLLRSPRNAERLLAALTRAQDRKR